MRRSTCARLAAHIQIDYLGYKHLTYSKFVQVSVQLDADCRRGTLCQVVLGSAQLHKMRQMFERRQKTAKIIADIFSIHRLVLLVGSRRLKILKMVTWRPW